MPPLPSHRIAALAIGAWALSVGGAGYGTYRVIRAANNSTHDVRNPILTAFALTTASTGAAFLGSQLLVRNPTWGWIPAAALSGAATVGQFGGAAALVVAAKNAIN
jgi:hypothetical protein